MRFCFLEISAELWVIQVLPVIRALYCQHYRNHCCQLKWKHVARGKPSCDQPSWWHHLPERISTLVLKQNSFYSGKHQLLLWRSSIGRVSSTHIINVDVKYNLQNAFTTASRPVIDQIDNWAPKPRQVNA